MADSKKSLREEGLKMRKRMTQEEWEEGSLALQRRILSSPLWEESRLVLLYSPIRREADTERLREAAEREGKKTAYPRVEGEKIRFYLAASEEDFVSGTFGIREPKEGLPPAGAFLKDNPEQVLVITPGLVFSEQGDRLGYGAGYYDRFFKEHPGVLSLGAAFERQIQKDLPVSPWDVPLQAIATEERLIIAGKE